MDLPISKEDDGRELEENTHYSSQDKSYDFLR